MKTVSRHGHGDPHCICGYDRQGLAEYAVCPECGVLEIRYHRRPPESPVARTIWYAWKFAIWDLFPQPSRRNSTAVTASIASRGSAIIAIWSTVIVLLWAWYAEESRSDLADILLLPTLGIVLLGIPYNLIALVFSLASLGEDTYRRAFRYITQVVVALVLPPTLLMVMILETWR